MPGSFAFRPVEANLTHDTELIGKMNPYVSFIAGDFKADSHISHKGGKHPQWNDVVTVPAGTQPTLVVELMDKDRITKDDHIGSFMIDLREVESRGQFSQWYPLTYKNKPAGEILMEASFQPEGGFIAGQTGFAQSGFREEVVDRRVSGFESAHAQVFTEQRQVVEPHTFLKEVEVVETRPVLKEIEVMESVKVMKDIQYTQAVPVKKQIEVVEPQVVLKEVEVIEPRLVTKEIQVIENVPVMRQIEVIENKTVMQEVQTFEPRTYTKQVEVIEHVPVMKQVTVTEPVTIKKDIEFVEPVITTQTITKEIRPAVVVDEKITTHVGPASVVGVATGVYEQRIVGEERLIGEEKLGHHHHHHHHDHHHKKF